MIRLSLAALCFLILAGLTLGTLSNVLADGGDMAMPRTWIYGYWGVFGQMGYTDKELGSLGPFVILALLCTVLAVFRFDKSCSNP